MTTKECTACHETKPLGDYHRQAKSTDGHRARCKTCIYADAHERRVRRDPDGYARRLEQKKQSKERARRRAGVQPQQLGRSPGCTYVRCKRVAVEEGLCGIHHDDLTNDRESPLVLTGGEWKRSGGVLRWVA